MKEYSDFTENDQSILQRHITDEPSKHTSVLESNSLLYEVQDHTWDNRKYKDLAFNAKSLILCSIPLKQPPKKADGTHETFFQTENGGIVFTILSRPEFGIPFGTDRLLYYWIVTQAVRRKSARITFENPTEILKDLGKVSNGQNHHWLKGALLRLVTSHHQIQPSKKHKAQVVIKNHDIFDLVNVYCDPNFEPEEGNIIVLKSDFFNSVCTFNGAVPLDFEIIRKLAKSPGALDLYALVCWRSYSIYTTGKNGVRIPLKSLKEQFSIPANRPTRKFKYDLQKTWITKINKALKEVYGEHIQFPVAIEGDNLIIYPAKMLPSQTAPLVDFPEGITQYIQQLPTEIVRQNEMDCLQALIREGYDLKILNDSIDKLGDEIILKAKYLLYGGIQKTSHQLKQEQLIARSQSGVDTSQQQYCVKSQREKGVRGVSFSIDD